MPRARRSRAPIFACDRSNASPCGKRSRLLVCRTLAVCRHQKRPALVTHRDELVPLPKRIQARHASQHRPDVRGIIGSVLPINNQCVLRRRETQADVTKPLCNVSRELHEKNRYPGE